MQAQGINWIQWVLAAMVLFMVVSLFAGWFQPEMPPFPEMPVIPTAQEVADLIVIPPMPEMPDTKLSVEDDKKELADDLAQDEMTDRDFRDNLADALEEECVDVEIDKRDITDISIRDTDYRGHRQHMTVTYELKVYFDNFGDEDEEEHARVEVTFEVVELDRDNDYEDAEVDEWSIGEIKRCSTE